MPARGSSRRSARARAHSCDSDVQTRGRGARATRRCANERSYLSARWRREGLSAGGTEGERASARSRALVSPAPGLPRASPENGQEPNTSNVPSIRLVLRPIKLDACSDNFTGKPSYCAYIVIVIGAGREGAGDSKCRVLATRGYIFSRARI